MGTVMRGAFELHRVAAGYGKRTVLHAPDLMIACHRTTALLGPGGSGKSTLLRLLGAAAQPLPPTLWYTGRIYRKVDSSAPLRVLWQQTCSSSLSLRHVLATHDAPDPAPAATAEPAALDAAPAEQQILHVWRDVAASAGLLLINAIDTPIMALPPSVRRLAELTLLLARPAQIVLIDEPERGACELHCAWIRTRLAALRGMCTMIVVTHDLSIAREISDEAILLLDGRIIESGATTALFHQPVHERTRSFITTGG